MSVCALVSTRNMLRLMLSADRGSIHRGQSMSRLRKMRRCEVYQLGYLGRQDICQKRIIADPMLLPGR